MPFRRYVYFATLMCLGYFSAQFWATGRYGVAVPMTLAALMVIALRNTIAPKVEKKS
jgi:hypothetical protein